MRSRSVGGAGSGPSAKLEYRRKELGNLGADHCKHLGALADRIGYIRSLVQGQLWAECSEVGDTLDVVPGCESGGFAQQKCLLQVTRGQFQHAIPVCRGHGENEVGTCSDSGRELSRGEV